MHLDLHNHTHYSPDSQVPPALLVARAKEAGLAGVAISDHNAVGGIPAAEMAADPTSSSFRPSRFPRSPATSLPTASAKSSPGNSGSQKPWSESLPSAEWP